jgi:hypothetical protein
VSAPHRGDSAEGSSWRQAGGEAGNAVEVAGERHGVIEELGDAKPAPDNGWRRLSVVVRSVAHDTEEDRCGGSHPRSMQLVAGSERRTTSVQYSGGCRLDWVGGGAERLVADNVLAIAGLGAGWFSWRPAARAVDGEGGGESRSVSGQQGTAVMAFGRRPGHGGAAWGSASGQSRFGPLCQLGLKPWRAVGRRMHGGLVDGGHRQVDPRRGEETLIGGSHMAAIFPILEIPRKQISAQENR